VEGRSAHGLIDLQSGRTQITKPPLLRKLEGIIRIVPLIAAEELDPATPIQIHTIISR
jgi:hypothetical protein